MNPGGGRSGPGGGGNPNSDTPGPLPNGGGGGGAQPKAQMTNDAVAVNSAPKRPPSRPAPITMPVGWRRGVAGVGGAAAGAAGVVSVVALVLPSSVLMWPTVGAVLEANLKRIRSV
jgi:hypothetical protein